MNYDTCMWKSASCNRDSYPLALFSCDGLLCLPSLWHSCFHDWILCFWVCVNACKCEIIGIFKSHVEQQSKLTGTQENIYT